MKCNPLHLLFLTIFLFLSHCQSYERMESDREISARSKGFHTFIQIKSSHTLPSKRIALHFKIKNISEMEDIRNVKILLFAYDKNEQILTPESRKTPELLCERKKKILPGTSQTCEMPEVQYAAEVERIKVHSVTVRYEEETSHVVDKNDLGEFMIWER